MPALTSIDGLSSGLKTTDIIDSLIKAARQPAALMEQKETDTTNIITQMKALQAKLLALSTETGNLSRTAAFNVYKLNVSDETVLGATSNGAVSSGSYNVQVLSIARNHTLASQGFSDQSLALFGAGTITIGVGTASPKTITIGATNNSLVGIKKAINDAGAGVTAAIVNDGSLSKPYRLVLTADKTGHANVITVNSSLTGTNNLNYSTALFDNPEMLTRNALSTSAISLGPTAAFTGTTNKTYTFTVAGTGAKTVGTDNITLNWTDGTHTGSIVVTQADAEVALVGAGSEGLKINLGSGTVYGGDKFQVSTFAPLLQEASDARVAVGATSGSGSPITITSDTNTFNNAIGGIDLTVKKESPVGTSVIVTANVDTSGLKDKINSLIKAYNDVNDFINTQNTYHADTKQTGPLFGDYTIQSVQTSLRTSLSSAVAGMKSKFNNLAAIGLRFDANGNLSIRDSSAFESALSGNLPDIIRLFTNDGKSTSANIEYVSSTDKTKMGNTYDVDITRAATQGYFMGTSIADPSITPLTLNSSNNRLKLLIDGATSDEIVLTERTYSTPADLTAELQSKIDADAKIGKRGLKVSWVSSGTGTGYVQLLNSSYGSSSKVNIILGLGSPAYKMLGLETGSSVDGVDVAGTINGEKATGFGQYLTGKEKNLTTDGLKLRITFGDRQLVDGPEGKITLTKGIAARLNDAVASMTRNGEGIVDRRISGYEGQVNDLKDRVAEFDKRLATKRTDLENQFYAMETALNQLNSEGQFLTNQISSMNNNWNFNRNK